MNQYERCTKLMYDTYTEPFDEGAPCTQYSPWNKLWTTIVLQSPHWIIQSQFWSKQLMQSLLNRMCSHSMNSYELKRQKWLTSQWLLHVKVQKYRNANWRAKLIQWKIIPQFPQLPQFLHFPHFPQLQHNRQKSRHNHQKSRLAYYHKKSTYQEPLKQILYERNELQELEKQLWNKKTHIEFQMLLEWLELTHIELCSEILVILHLMDIKSRELLTEEIMCHQRLKKHIIQHSFFIFS